MVLTPLLELTTHDQAPLQPDCKPQGVLNAAVVVAVEVALVVLTGPSLLLGRPQPLGLGLQGVWDLVVSQALPATATWVWWFCLGLGQMSCVKALLSLLRVALEVAWVGALLMSCCLAVLALPMAEPAHAACGCHYCCPEQAAGHHAACVAALLHWTSVLGHVVVG